MVYISHEADRLLGMVAEFVGHTAVSVQLTVAGRLLGVVTAPWQVLCCAVQCAGGRLGHLSDYGRHAVELSMSQTQAKDRYVDRVWQALGCVIQCTTAGSRLHMMTVAWHAHSYVIHVKGG